jgi:hypothetical protein
MSQFMYCSIPECNNRTNLQGFCICSSCFAKAEAMIDTDKYEGHDKDYIGGVKKGILMGYCLGCSLAYPLEDMNKQGLCEECQGGEEE